MYSICSQQAHDISNLLFLCYFRLGGMIHYLGGTYTRNFLNFASIDPCLIYLSNIPIKPGEPPHDFPMMQHLFHQHTPFKGLIRSAIKDILVRNR